MNMNFDEVRPSDLPQETQACMLLFQKIMASYPKATLVIAVNKQGNMYIETSPISLGELCMMEKALSEFVRQKMFISASLPQTSEKKPELHIAD